MANKKEELARQILELVGGEENISIVSHCMTRLRLNIKDKSLVKVDEIKTLKGVLGAQWSGNQFQVIIGQTVPDIYAELNKLGTFEQGNLSTENMDKEEKKSGKNKILGVFSNLIDVLSSVMNPLLPVIVAASLFRVILAICGPLMFNIIQEGSNIHTLFTFVGDAGFYFFPIFVAYTSAKKFNTSPVLAMFLGAILVHPTLIGLAEEGLPFTVMGIPATLHNYSSALLPSIFAVWIMSYVEKFITKIVPDTLRILLNPVLTMLVMLPITLVVVGPLGFAIGNAISNFLLSLSDMGGIYYFIAMMLIGAVYQFLVMTGMHHLMMVALIMSISSAGFDAVVLPSAILSAPAIWGMSMAAFLRIKNREERSAALSYFVTGFVGGITEPAIYGIGLKYKRPFIGMSVGAAVGGLFLALFKVRAYSVLSTASFLSATMFLGGPSGNTNLIYGVICMVITFIVATAVTYFVGWRKDDPVLQK